jgi:hypothetical protein
MVIAVVAVAFTGLGGACTGASGGSVTPTSVGRGSTSPTSQQATSPSSASSADREAADRLAVKQAWAKYWTVHEALLGTPAAEWPSAVAAVAVDPTRAQVLSEAALFQKSGLRFYGQVINRPYWTTSIGGKGVAVMGDCMDSSHHGTEYVKSGNKRTVGVARNNTRVTLVKGGDGTWRVQKIEYLLDIPC